VLSEDFELHGAKVIERVREKYPQVYLSAIVSLLPKQQQIEKLSPLGDITDEELAQIEELLAATRARTVRELEQHNGAALELEPSDAKQQQGQQDNTRKCSNIGHFSLLSDSGEAGGKPRACVHRCMHPLPPGVRGS
jgi:hypothetical protein